MESIDQIPMFGKSGQMATEFLKSGSNASQTRVTKMKKKISQICLNGHIMMLLCMYNLMASMKFD